MGIRDEIADMELALKARRIPVAELCRKAEIAETTWGRWKNGKVSPWFSSWTAAKAAFADLIAEPVHVSAPASLHPSSSTVTPAAAPQGAEKHIGQGLAEDGERHHAPASVEDAA